MVWGREVIACVLAVRIQNHLGGCDIVCVLVVCIESEWRNQAIACVLAVCIENRLIVWNESEWGSQAIACVLAVRIDSSWDMEASVQLILHPLRNEGLRIWHIHVRRRLCVGDIKTIEAKVGIKGNVDTKTTDRVARGTGFGSSLGNALFSKRI